MRSRRPTVQRNRAPRAEPLELKPLFDAHYNSICHLLYRLGVSSADLEDAAQEVFWVAARRLEDIEAGREQSFLYGIALRMSYRARRKRQTHDARLSPLELADDIRCPKHGPEEELGERQTAVLLRAALEQMTPELKTVFVLCELEQLDLKDIATIVEIPLGTVNSRLRRARAEFAKICKRMQAIHQREELS